MSKKKGKSLFWVSYADLMTSMFFVMLVLFIVSIYKMHADTEEIIIQKKRLENILQLESQFSVLGNSDDLKYDEGNKMFFAKDFVGIEIFDPNEATIRPVFIPKVDSVGVSLSKIVSRLHEKNPDIQFQLVIEGTAAIPFKELLNHKYDSDNKDMYLLSYCRALSLYLRWREKGIDLRKYNTEVIIAGSGFNGINRDKENENNNKRFIIQIIPKMSKPDNLNN